VLDLAALQRHVTTGEPIELRPPVHGDREIPVLRDGAPTGLSPRLLVHANLPAVMIFSTPPRFTRNRIGRSIDFARSLGSRPEQRLLERDVFDQQFDRAAAHLHVRHGIGGP